MATFTSKFGIGDLVHLKLQASYYQSPVIYRIHSVEFGADGDNYSLELVDNPSSYIHLVQEEALSLVQE